MGASRQAGASRMGSSTNRGGTRMGKGRDRNVQINAPLGSGGKQKILDAGGPGG